MRYKLVMDLGNDAFYTEDGVFDPAPEMGRILRKLAKRLEVADVDDDVRLRDINGNDVGRASYVRGRRRS